MNIELKYNLGDIVAVGLRHHTVQIDRVDVTLEGEMNCPSVKFHAVDVCGNGLDLTGGDFTCASPTERTEFLTKKIESLESKISQLNREKDQYKKILTETQ